MMHIINRKILHSYWHNEVIYIMDFLTDEEIELLKIFEISIEDKKYTYYDFDCIYSELNQFNPDRILDEYFGKPDKKLPASINQKRYDKLMRKLKMIARNIKIIELE